MSKWVRSNTAHIIFRYSSVTVLLVGIFFVLMMTPWFARLEAVHLGDIGLRVIGGCLGILGAPAGLIIWFGMLVFCLTEDRSGTTSRILWCCLFLAAAFFASSVYFFTVYRKQTALSD